MFNKENHSLLLKAKASSNTVEDGQTTAAEHVLRLCASAPVIRVLLESMKGTDRFMWHLSWAQAARQGIHQVLLLGPCGWDPKLFAGLLQHRHCQLSQGAVLQVGPQLVLWHLHFGLLLSSASAVSWDWNSSSSFISYLSWRYAALFLFLVEPNVSEICHLACTNLAGEADSDFSVDISQIFMNFFCKIKVTKFSTEYDLPVFEAVWNARDILSCKIWKKLSLILFVYICLLSTMYVIIIFFDYLLKIFCLLLHPNVAHHFRLKWTGQVPFVRKVWTQKECF